MNKTILTDESCDTLRILLFDIETAPNLSYTWCGKWEQNVIEFKEEGYILSFAWKFLGDKKVKSCCINDFKRDGKKRVVQKLWELFDQADVIIAHNGNQFDIKWANRAFIFYQMTPPSPYKQIDTLKEARNKFKFNSNSLNDLGKYLKLGCKIETGGFELWKLCMAGDQKAFRKMTKYNKQDVVLLEKVYLKLRPFMTNHPKINVFDRRACPNCGSPHLIKKGVAITGDNVYQKWLCKECGKWSTGNYSKFVSKDNRIK